MVTVAMLSSGGFNEVPSVYTENLSKPALKDPAKLTSKIQASSGRRRKRLCSDRAILRLVGEMESCVCVSGKTGSQPQGSQGATSQGAKQTKGREKERTQAESQDRACSFFHSACPSCPGNELMRQDKALKGAMKSMQHKLKTKLKQSVQHKITLQQQKVTDSQIACVPRVYFLMRHNAG